MEVFNKEDRLGEILNVSRRDVTAISLEKPFQHVAIKGMKKGGMQRGGNKLEKKTFKKHMYMCVARL
jgi:hypothetical protein